MNTTEREKSIYRITLLGSIVNALLLTFKFIAGILSGSAAMLADAIHSLSDFATDIIVIIFVRLSNKPQDKDHDFGHGKYETLATAFIGLALLAVGFMLCYEGMEKIFRAWQGQRLQQPGWLALWAALISIALKEWIFRATRRVGTATGSPAVVANAWHHRSDALSSIGTALGIGGAILLGPKWAVLDPIAATIVSLFIIRAAYSLLRRSGGDLLEESLPDEIESEITRFAEEEPQVSEIHHLCTRRIGSYIAIEMHLRMPGNISLFESHQHASNIEQKLRRHFGHNTHIILHVEPLKVEGQYRQPEQ